MNKEHILWVERYRPTSLENYLFYDQHIESAVHKMINGKTIPHLLLSGNAGCGKTTLAQILIRSLEVEPNDVLILNASDENSVDTMREKIKTFVSTLAFGNFKIVLLEEADYISPNGQALLRRLMEEYSDTARFILTCNYDNKIIPAIKSRCQHFHFIKPDRDAVTELAATVLLKEKIKFSVEVLDKYIAIGYPDIRKIINLLQQHSIDGKLIFAGNEDSSNDYKIDLLSLLEENKWEQARELVCQQVTSEEWEDLYRFLYENLHRSPKFSDKSNWEAGIVAIAEHLYKHSIVADPEINMAALFIKLGQD